MTRKAILIAALTAAALFTAAGTASAQLIKKPEDLNPFKSDSGLNQGLRDLDKGRLDMMSRDPRPGRDYTKIYIKNETPGVISVAVHYLPFQNAGDTSGLKDYSGGSGFVTKAWFNLKPGEQIHVANTANRNVYAYAEDRGGVWGGDEKTRVNVRDGGNTRSLNFFLHNTGAEIQEESVIRFTKK